MGLVASCPLTQPDPAGVRAEPAAPFPPGRSSNGSALFPHVGQSMTGPELFPEAALCAFLRLQIKGVVLPQHSRS